MKSKGQFIILLCLCAVNIFLAANIYGRVNGGSQVASGATVKSASVNLGLYSDSACTKTLSSISWGNLDAGSTSTFTFYVKNTGSSKITLNMATSNWSPTSASKAITLSWNQNQAALNPNQTLKSTLTLTISHSTGSSAFKVTIVVTGTG